jgi:hypothetical protein
VAPSDHHLLGRDAHLTVGIRAAGRGCPELCALSAAYAAVRAESAFGLSGNGMMQFESAIIAAIELR